MSKYITGRFSGRDNVTALPVWDQNVAGRESESGSGSLRNGGRCDSSVLVWSRLQSVRASSAKSVIHQVPVALSVSDACYGE